jgi:DNA-binding PadR family transcriptional regulator
MIAKGWIEKQMDANRSARYRITPAGEAALKAKFPDPLGFGDLSRTSRDPDEVRQP